MRFIPNSTSTIIQTRIQKENRNALSFLACHSLKKDCNAKKWPVLFYTTIFPPKTCFYERKHFQNYKYNCVHGCYFRIQIIVLFTYHISE